MSSEVSNRLSSLKDGFDAFNPIGPLSGDKLAARLMRRRGLYASPSIWSSAELRSSSTTWRGTDWSPMPSSIAESGGTTVRALRRPPFEVRWVVDDTAAQTQFALSGTGIAGLEH